MDYDFIEIGTSDFDTLLERSTDETGLSVEPLGFYLDNLPNRKHVIKVNCAISDSDGILDIYWLDPNDIDKYNLSPWLRGCNSIGSAHPTVVSELSQIKEHSLTYHCTKCECISWDTFVSRYDIRKIDYLKLDTEGHDLTILRAMLNSKFRVFPKTILFEHNVLTNPVEYDLIMQRLTDMGYSMISQGDNDIKIELADKNK